MLFALLDDNGTNWLWLEIFADVTYTEFNFQFEDLPEASIQSKILFFPLHWTRVCFSKDLQTSQAKLVVDGELLLEREVKVKSVPDNLNLVLGSWTHPILGWTWECSGQTTNVNVFSPALTVQQMESHTSPGEGECGLEGDFLSWEKSLEEEQWALHSKARWVDLDGGLEGPCRAKAKMNVFPMNKWHYQSDCMKHCESLVVGLPL